jgi:hypothetical protein
MYDLEKLFIFTLSSKSVSVALFKQSFLIYLGYVSLCFHPLNLPEIKCILITNALWNPLLNRKR